MSEITLESRVQIKDNFQSLPDEIVEQNFNETSNFLEYLKRIDREDLSEVITNDHPLLYFSQEIYREDELGIKGGGGLGVLAGDTTRIAEKLGLPLVVVTPFYSKKNNQLLINFEHTDRSELVDPREHRFRNIGGVAISSLMYENINIDVYAKRRGSTKIVTMYEPNIGQLYPGSADSDHRLYQEAVTGFGGYKAIKEAGIEPSFIQMNESPTIFAAIARLDDLCMNGLDFDDALDQVRKLTIYTNHTLVPAVEGNFKIDQFESLILPNIKNEMVANWVRRQFNNDGTLKLSTLAIELAQTRNGVSKLHARVSSNNYKDKNGNRAEFEAVTNGISDHWIAPNFIEQYHNLGAIDEFGLPTENYKTLLENLDAQTLHEIKCKNRGYMNDILEHRLDQYDNPIHIPEDAKMFDFKRRFASYKRAKMIFQDPNRLASIIESNNAHIVFTGKPHSSDKPMVNELYQLLNMINDHPVLKERVHYVQDYDEEVGQALSIGGDCAINVPVVGEEACGTSWMKDIANGKLLISTEDGGVADISPAVYLEVTGNSYLNESNMLYQQMEQACNIIANDNSRRDQVVKQLKAYLPIISGPRMVEDYLKLKFPKKVTRN